MKNLLLLALLMLFFAPLNAQKAKLSPQTKQYLAHAGRSAAGQPLEGYVYKLGANNAVYISALVKVAPLATPDLAASGSIVGTRAGNIWSVQVPVNNVSSFINTAGIEYIELDQPVFSNMDTARVTTHVDSVHAGINMPMPYTGKDVVVGIIDAGFDYTHVTLFDTTGVYYRVKKIWEQKKPGIPPSQFFYGNELVTPTAMFNAKTDAYNFSHGTHVAGIAAGSGFGGDNTNARYRGMAYESDLVFVGITPTEYSWTSTGLADILDAMSYIFSYAVVNGKPAVANLSWGCSIGPHDGTSLFSQACDNLTGPGKIFVCSAGNNGQNLLHFNKTFSPTDTVINTVLNPADVLGQKRAWVDAWGDSGQSFCLQASLYNGTTMLTTLNSYCTDDISSGLYDLYMIGQNGDTCFISITTDSATFNNKPRIFLDVYNKTYDMIVLKLTANNGTVNMWTGYVKNKTGYYGSFTQYPGIVPIMPGNTSSTISDIASSNSAIAVGAYASKNVFTNIQSNQVSYTTYVVKGNIAPFSSLGPTADGRVKPDITGPGLVLGSGLSSYDSTYANTTSSGYPSVVSSYYKQQNNKTYQYGMLMGTSMSSPAAAGIVALLLQAKPTLTPDEVKDLLKQTAIKDNFTGNIPAQGSNTWGHGKINGYRALFAILEELGIETVATSGEQLAFILYPNPNKGNYNIDYNTASDETLNLEVYNVAGVNIIKKDWKVNKGGNRTTINLQEVPAGVYFTKLSSLKGSVVIKMVIE